MQDIKGLSHVRENLDHPIGTMLYTVSCLPCMTVSLAHDIQNSWYVIRKEGGAA